MASSLLNLADSHRLLYPQDSRFHVVSEGYLPTIIVWVIESASSDPKNKWWILCTIKGRVLTTRKIYTNRKKHFLTVLLSSVCSNANAQILECPSQFEQLFGIGMCSPKIHTQYQSALNVRRISECYACVVEFVLSPSVLEFAVRFLCCCLRSSRIIDA